MGRRKYRGPCRWSLADDPSVSVQGEVEADVSDGAIGLSVTWSGKDRWRLILRQNGTQWVSTGVGPRLALTKVSVRDDGCDLRGPWKDADGDWIFEADTSHVGDPAGIAALQDAIRHLEGCESQYDQTAEVEEKTPDGREIVWSGYVEVFRLLNHPKQVYRAYAWSEPATGTKRRFFVVLHTGPIDSPSKAVQGSIYADAMELEKAKRALS